MPNNNKNCKNGGTYKNGGAYWNRGAYLQKHIRMGALIRKGALIGRRALNRIITVTTYRLEKFQLFLFLQNLIRLKSELLVYVLLTGPICETN